MSSSAKTTKAVPYYNMPPQRHHNWPRLVVEGVYYFGPIWCRMRMKDTINGEVIDFEFSSKLPEADLWRPANYPREMARPAAKPAPRPWWRRLADRFAAWIGGAS